MLPPGEPMQLHVAPVPVSTTTASAETPDGARVVLQCNTPLGVQVYTVNGHGELTS